MTSPTGYSRLQIVLHWVVFALILQQFVFHDAISAAWDQFTEGGDAGFALLVAAHVAGGVLVLLFALWRSGLRARCGVPDAGEASRVRLAAMTHAGLYALMILMPVSGAIAWFGGFEAAAEVHNLLRVVLLALVALHIAGALYHQFVLRDGTLARMRRPLG